jgi:predicted nucleotidyltransferase
MKPSAALAHKRAAAREATTRFRTANPRVFGSVVHGTDQDGSDLDVLVDALPGATLFDLGGLQAELEDLLGVSVDLVTPADLPAPFRQRVLAEALPI